MLADVAARAPQDTTCSVRARRHPDFNEDRTLSSRDYGVAAVFDGMGGVEGGELASTAALATFTDRLSRIPPIADEQGRRDWLAGSILAAAGTIGISRQASSAAAMQDTTAAVVVRAGDNMLVASVGDSRVYQVSAENELTQVTEDDDLVGSSGNTGSDVKERVRRVLDTAITPADLQAEPMAEMLFTQRNTITKSLGQQLNVKLDFDAVPVTRGDLFLVCSDGVHDNLSADEIAETIVAHRAKGELAVSEALCLAASVRAADTGHLRAKDDDISAVVLEIR
jgi:protein phosphatase